VGLSRDHQATNVQATEPVVMKTSLPSDWALLLISVFLGAIFSAP